MAHGCAMPGRRVCALQEALHERFFKVIAKPAQGIQAAWCVFFLSSHTISDTWGFTARTQGFFNRVCRTVTLLTPGLWCQEVRTKSPLEEQSPWLIDGT